MSTQDPFAIVFDVVEKPECCCECVDIGVGHQKVAENPDCPRCTPEGLTGAVLTALAEAGLLRAISGPQGDEQAAPRVWAMPEIPPDVTAVLDRDGVIIRRNHEGRWIHNGPGILAGVRIGWTDIDLVRLRGPLTEIVDGSGT